MLRDDIAGRARDTGLYLVGQLEAVHKEHPALKAVRGRGLMVGAEFDADISFLPAEGIRHGIMINVIQNRILRFAPPLVVSTAEIHQGLTVIRAILKEKGL